MFPNIIAANGEAAGVQAALDNTVKIIIEISGAGFVAVVAQ